MIGRHELRAKTLEVLYSNEMNQKNEISLRKQLHSSLNEIYNLYLSKFSIFTALQNLSAKKIELAKKKNIPTEYDLNPRTTFRDNKVFSLINSNKELENHLIKNDQLKWKSDDVEIIKLFEEIQQTELYKDYLEKNTQSFAADKRFAIKLFENHIAENQLINEQFEDKNIYWAGVSIANDMVVATLDSFTSKSDEHIGLYKIYKSKEDEDFVNKLLNEVLNRKEFLDKEIEKYIKNWDLERLAKIDKIILQMSICEIHHFPSIPNKVVINEYVDLSKEYSSEKSRIYINGILDKIVKNL